MNDQAKDEVCKNTPFSAPPSLIQKVDQAAEKKMLSRSAYLRIALIEKLDRDKTETAVNPS